MTGSTLNANATRDRSTPARILVVDDEAGVRKAVARGLIAAGYDVTCADSGEEALLAARNAPSSFDLVISDIMMPGMSGIELVEHLQRMDARLPVLLISGYPGTHLAEMAHFLGQHDFLEKPFSPAQLAARVNERIGNRPAR